MKQVFPFSAVVGQAQVKLALSLLAVDPSVGGLLVTGSRGTAKSTLARSLADVAIKGLQQMVTLPLGATEEMLTGTLDLQQALDTSQIKFAPGILSRAHQGLLYVDEVNLLPDNLVDLLLDVAASGINYVERDGISHQHAAEFVLMGTMNPDEGELRPQLLDRFGLAVELTNAFSAQDRVEIVKRRQAFEQDPAAFIARYATAQQALATQIHQAQQSLSYVEISDEQLLYIAQQCIEAQVDGLRGDLVWAKAARAHAALMGRQQVAQTDLDAVAELVLWHRRQLGQAQPPSGHTNPDPDKKPDTNATNSPPTSMPGSGGKPPLPPHTENQKQTSSHGSVNQTDADQPSGSGQGYWGQVPATELTIPQLPEVNSRRLNQYKRDTKNLQQRLPRLQSSQGRLGRGKGANTQGAGRVNWFATLVSQLQGNRRLQHRPQRGADKRVHIILLDTSGSTLTHQAQVQAQARSWVTDLTQAAYLKRQGVVLIEFGNDQVRTVFAHERAPKHARQALDALAVGGGTPFLQALAYAQVCATRLLKQDGALRVNNYVITDTRVPLPAQPIALPGESWLIDLEQAKVKRGHGQRLAELLGAHYCPWVDQPTGAAKQSYR